MNCTNCGKNRDHQRLSYPICYIIRDRLSFDKFDEIWDTVCHRCCLNLGYAMEITEEVQKNDRNEQDFLDS